jgi:polysaccharide biosynthesis protein PslG
MRAPRPIFVVLGSVIALAVAVALLAVVSSGKSVGKTEVGALQPIVSVPASGRLPREFFGIVTEDVLAHPGSYRTRTLNQQAGIGIGLVRQTFDWATIERKPGVYDLTSYDGLVAALAAHHMRLLPVLLDPPKFRSSAPAQGARPGTYPPKDLNAMASLASLLVRRYGPHGTFWRDRPGLPKVPIHSWQIWNEPSLPAYWPTGPDPAAYTQMLRVVGAAIKAKDPSAEIVSAGIPQSRLGMPFADFLKGMYAAGARSAFDTLAIHPYAENDAGVAAAVRSARQIMDENGDRSAPIWVTEVGWASAGPASQFTVGARGQAQRIKSTLTTLVNIRAQEHLRGVVYFGWRDGAPYAPTFKDFWGLHTGLLTVHGTPKPALGTFADTLARLRH